MFVTTWRRPLHTRPAAFPPSFDQLLHELEQLGAPRRAPQAQPRPENHSFVWRAQSDHDLLQALVPGLKAEDLSLTATEEGITLRGARQAELPEGFKPLHRERQALRFEQTLRFSQPVDLDKIEASLVQGVLTLKAPHLPEVQPRQIEIKVQ